MKNTSTKVTPELQKELAEYGLFRHKAVQETSASDPFMGITREGDKYIGHFSGDIAKLQGKQAQIAVVAPENESFDMLITKDFNKAITTARPDDLRAYIRSIVDKV